MISKILRCALFLSNQRFWEKKFSEKFSTSPSLKFAKNGRPEPLWSRGFSAQVLMALLLPYFSSKIAFVQQNIAFAQQNIAVAQQNIAFAQQKIAFAQQNIVFAQQNIAFVQQNIAFAQQNIPFAQQNIAFAHTDTLVFTQNLSFL